jgi:hypothetical protein
MASSATKGIWIWAAVFGGGFVVGYALMSLVVADPGTTDGPVAVGDSVDAAAAEPAPEHGLDPDPDPALEPAPASPAAPAAAEPAAPAPPPTVAAPEEPAPPEDPAAADPTAEEAAADPADQPWWEACHGRTCRVEFGQITGGLSIRKGSVSHGSTVDWDATFARAARIEVLPTSPRTDVEVLGIGLSPTGAPAAAEIRWKKGSRAVLGVISLDLGDPGKQVVMRPVTAP